jgi:hypothetical protein
MPDGTLDAAAAATVALAAAADAEPDVAVPAEPPEPSSWQASSDIPRTPTQTGAVQLFIVRAL